MSKLSGPLLYDSLDKPNATESTKQVHTRNDMSRVWIVLILVIAVLIIILGVYVLVWLNNIAFYNNAASLALWAISYGFIFGIVGLIVVAVFYLFILALKRATITLNEGVQASVFSVLFARYDRAFDRMTERYFDMWQTRMEHSQFSGVSTLTLDQSVQSETSSTSVETGGDNQDDTNESPLVGKDESILEELIKRGIINRSNNSLLLGFSQE